MMAGKKDSGITVKGVIDGWKEKQLNSSDESAGMRIDHIWCNQEVLVKCSDVVFNEKREPVVSDHFGIMIECENGTESMH